MRNQLQIGELAHLLGVTTKTIRHYHRVGLLAEPARTAGGYRQYTAADLVRLVRIKRLQAMGLSLDQIRQVLGAPVQDRSLRQVLEQLAEALDGKMEALAAQRAYIRVLLADDTRNPLDHPAQMPAILNHAQELLGNAAAGITPDLWEQDTRIFGMLEAVQWPAEYHEHMQAAVAHFAEHPEEYQQMRILAEPLLALAHEPADSPQVERLVEAMLASGAATFLQSLPDGMAALDEPFGEMVREVMLSALAPAQRRFLEVIQHRLREDHS